MLTCRLVIGNYGQQDTGQCTDSLNSNLPKIESISRDTRNMFITFFLNGFMDFYGKYFEEIFWILTSSIIFVLCEHFHICSVREGDITWSWFLRHYSIPLVALR